MISYANEVMMYDYRGLEALFAIIEHQSFDLAAQKLHISQSAISQRLKSLQRYFNDPLLIRSIPYRATPLGEYLLGHYKQVHLLETTLDSQIKQQKMQLKFSIAISRDSLETWFMELFETEDLFKNHVVEIIADDQDITIEYLQKGLVTSCFTTIEKPPANCNSCFIGYMNYFLVSSPSFKEKYFANNKHKQNLLNAPAVIFDQKDKLHDKYLDKYFNIKNERPPYHVIPSVRGFKKFVLKGYAYALIPEIDIRKELKDEQLVPLFKNKNWKMPVYFHSWETCSREYKKFYDELISIVKNHFFNGD